MIYAFDDCRCTRYQFYSLLLVVSEFAKGYEGIFRLSVTFATNPNVALALKGQTGGTQFLVVLIAWDWYKHTTGR